MSGLLSPATISPTLLQPVPTTDLSKATPGAPALDPEAAARVRARAKETAEKR